MRRVLTIGFLCSLVWLSFERALESPSFRDAINTESLLFIQSSREGMPPVEPYLEELRRHPIYNYRHPAEIENHLPGLLSRTVSPDRPWDFEPPGETTEILFSRTSPEGEHLFSVAAHIEASGRRFVTAQNSRADKRAVFLGCSYVFGDFVEDKHTLPSLFQDKVPDMEVVNLGLSGGGVHTIFKELKLKGPRLDDIEPKAGVGIYLYFYRHLHRLVCRGSCYFKPYNEWLWYRPWLRFSPEGGVEIAGIHKDRIQKLWSHNRLDWLVSKSNVLSYMNVAWPGVYGAESIELLGATVEEIRELMKSRLGVERFVVVMAPADAHATDPLVAAEFRRRGIEVFDYSRRPINLYTGGKFKIPIDGHPHPFSNFILSRWIAEDLFR